MSENDFPGPGVRPLRLQIGQQGVAAIGSAGKGRPIVLIHGNSAFGARLKAMLRNVAAAPPA